VTFQGLSPPAVSYASSATCVTGLTGLAAQWGWHQGVSSAGENSLECRAYHAIASLSTGDASHCTHYSAASTQCAGKVIPNVAHYCDVLEYNCGINGTTGQFANKTQCLITAAGYPNALADDATANGGNNLGCREYHAQAAAGSGAFTHCEHGGPSGAGVCGSRLQAWGSILAANCNDTTAATFIGAVGNITATAAIPTGVSTASPYVPYSTTFDTSMNTQICRIYHLGVAATLPDHCPHGSISGGGLCGANIVSNICVFIQAACGFGANATYQFADMTACTTGLALIGNSVNITLGAAGDMAGNTLACRYYHAGVAGSYLTGGVAEAAPGAMESNRYHCGHVLKVATTGGCGNVPLPSKAPTAAPSAAAALPIVATGFALVASVFVL